MKAEKSMLEIMKSCEIVHNLENDEEFRQSFFELADGIQSQYENICRRHEDFCEASVDEVEEFYSLYNYYYRILRRNIMDAKLEYEYANFRQTKKAMKSRKISKLMSPKTMGRVFADKLEDAIANEEYPLIWEIYGEIYAARMLGFLFKEHYDKLWHRLYPYITRVRLVPEGRIDDEK